MKRFLLAFYLVSNSAFAYAIPQLEVDNVHGLFTRSQIIDLTSFRAKVTGLIYDTETEATCTGTLIGPKQIITAAHCVYNFEKKEWSEGLTFTPGKLNKDDPGSGTFSFKKIFIQKEYVDSMAEEYDFAIVELDTNIGDTIGWVGFRSLRPAESVEGKSQSISFAGYPGDKDYGTLWKVSCPAAVKGKLLSYACDSYGGMSGSALFQTSDAQNFIIGVHTFGGPEKNGGFFIDSRSYTLIDAWKNSTNYSKNTVIHLKK
ncbi:MAG: trypsin-like serine protease [Rhizobacter sp.]|nr:trypsin-like serine protease [Bacteriovorax sp.]